jgi:hypothetical protein
VKPFATIRHLLSGLAMLGLVLGPLARPAMATDFISAMSGPQLPDAAHAAMASADIAMPDSMPCCPDQVPTLDCGMTCPLIAICSSQFFQDTSAWLEPLVRASLRSVVVPGNDPKLTGHLYGPPAKPPKTSV